jgi:hypothetical protein
MTESEQILLLQRWDGYLAEQGCHLDACIVKLMGHPYTPDEQSTAFLLVDEKLSRPTIEKAVSEFIHGDAWPTLGTGEYLHLVFRAHMARVVIKAILRGDSQGAAIKPGLPDLKNREDAIRWFLVDLWNIGGRAFLGAMGDDWLKTRARK